MQHDVSIEPIGYEELSHYNSWFQDASSGMLLISSRNTVDMFSGASQPLAWKGVREHETVAVIVINVSRQRVGHLNFVVRARARRQGVGGSVVAQTLAQPEVRQLSSLVAVVEPDNTGAQKILTRNGFSRIGDTAEGYLEYSRRQNQ